MRIFRVFHISTKWIKATKRDWTASDTDLKSLLRAYVYFLSLKHLQPQELILKRCAFMYHVRKLVKN